MFDQFVYTNYNVVGLELANAAIAEKMRRDHKLPQQIWVSSKTFRKIKQNHIEVSTSEGKSKIPVKVDGNLSDEDVICEGTQEG